LQVKNFEVKKWILGHPSKVVIRRSLETMPIKKMMYFNNTEINMAYPHLGKRNNDGLKVMMKKTN
jgi:hypothetical protein